MIDKEEEKRRPNLTRISTVQHKGTLFSDTNATEDTPISWLNSNKNAPETNPNLIRVEESKRPNEAQNAIDNADEDDMDELWKKLRQHDMSKRDTIKTAKSQNVPKNYDLEHDRNTGAEHNKSSNLGNRQELMQK